MSRKRTAETELNRDNWNRTDDDDDECSYDGAFPQASAAEMAKRKIRIPRRRGIVTGEKEVPSIFKQFSGFSNTNGGDSSKASANFSFSSNSTQLKTKSSFGGPSFQVPTSATSPKSSFTSNATSSSSTKFSSALESEKVASFITQKESLSQKQSSFVSQKESPSQQQSSFVSQNETSSTGTKSKLVNGHDSETITYLGHLKDLNEGVLKWIQKHLEKNVNISLLPVFDDYRKHFEELEKKYKPKFKKLSENKESVDITKTKGTEKKSSDDITLKTKEAPSSIFGEPIGKSIAASPKNNSSNPLLSKDSSKASSFGGSDSSKPSSIFNFGSSSTEPKPKSGLSFGSSQSEPKSGFSFGSSEIEPKPKSGFSFGSSENEPKPKSGFSFGSSESESKPKSGFSFGGGGSGFSFGKTSPTETTSNPSPFGNSSSFSFSAVTNSKPAEPEKKEDDEDAPPKPELVEFKEEGSVYDKKCKLFYKKGPNYVDKGVGTLFLIPVKDSNKTQLLVRAATTLGNVLLNIMINPSMPTQRTGKNNVLIVCVPNPPIESAGDAQTPVPMLLRVKTGEDADELLGKIDEFKTKAK